MVGHDRPGGRCHASRTFPTRRSDAREQCANAGYCAAAAGDHDQDSGRFQARGQGRADDLLSGTSKVVGEEQLFAV